MCEGSNQVDSRECYLSLSLWEWVLFGVELEYFAIGQQQHALFEFLAGDKLFLQA